MSDPKTFEDLRRMARELPKNVLVPAHHIHSLLDETERLVERNADLQRQLVEKQAEIEAMRPMVDAARYHERSVTFYSHGTSSDPYHCDVCRAYKVYEARKQP